MKDEQTTEEFEDGRWQCLEKQTALDSGYYLVSHDRYRRRDGSIGDYYYVDIPGSTMVVPRVKERRNI